MSNAMEDIYEIVKAQSETLTGACGSSLALLQAEAGEMKEGFAVCWLWNEILFGRIDEGVMSFAEGKSPDFDRDLREIRLFNRERELYLYRAEKGFNFRRRIDGIGEGTEYIEAEQVLWGTEGQVEGTWTTLSENRGIRLTIPIQASGVDDRRNRVALVTRNYIGETENCQAGIVDCRFVDLIFRRCP